MNSSLLLSSAVRRWTAHGGSVCFSPVDAAPGGRSMVDGRVRLGFVGWRRALLLSGAVLLSLCFGPGVAQERREVDLSLALAIDISGSIDPDEAELQRQGYVKAFTDPQIKKAILGGYNGRIAVAYYEWSDAWRQQLLIDWTLLDSDAAIEAFADRLAKMPITVLTRT